MRGLREDISLWLQERKLRKKLKKIEKKFDATKSLRERTRLMRMAEGVLRRLGWVEAIMKVEVKDGNGEKEHSL